MRKFSYVATFFAVATTLLFNVFSRVRTDWLVVRSEALGTKVTVTYGLAERCEEQIMNLPGPNNGRVDYTKYECREFPAKVTDRCEKERSGFCIAWTSARYMEELAVWCAAGSLVAILFGVSTGSRRRRIWKVVAGLVLLHAAFQIATFAVITDQYRFSRYLTFQYARPGAAYVLNPISWIVSLVVAAGVGFTGISAEKGHRWAAGNRAYSRIGDA